MVAMVLKDTQQENKSKQLERNLKMIQTCLFTGLIGAQKGDKTTNHRNSTRQNKKKECTRTWSKCLAPPPPHSVLSFDVAVLPRLLE